MFKLYREQHIIWREKTPFAVVATADEAEDAAREELLEGEADGVWVEDVGYLHTADLSFECARCECTPGNIGAGAMVWYAGENTEVPYCSHECAMGLEVAR